jgi:hypothetical protein
MLLSGDGWGASDEDVHNFWALLRAETLALDPPVALPVHLALVRAIKGGPLQSGLFGFVLTTCDPDVLRIKNEIRDAWARFGLPRVQLRVQGPETDMPHYGAPEGDDKSYGDNSEGEDGDTPE